MITDLFSFLLTRVAGWQCNSQQCGPNQATKYHIYPYNSHAAI